MIDPDTQLASWIDAVPVAADGPLLGPPGDGLRDPGHAAETARSFLRAHPGLLGDGADGLIARATELMPDGGARVRFGARVQGLPVVDGDVVVVLDRDARVRAVSGTCPPATTLVERPRIGASAALENALAALHERWPEAELREEAPAVLVAVVSGEEVRASWRVQVHGVAHEAGVERAVRRDLHVDAATGDLLEERDGLQALVGSGLGADGVRKPLGVVLAGDGRYVLQDPERDGLRTFTANAGLHLPGWLVRSDTPDAWDDAGPAAGAAVDAHFHGALVYDWLGAAGRGSLDGQASAIRLVVHYGRGVDHAFWDGRRAVFGDGGPGRPPLSAALDVVAHELVHGVTQAQSALVYRGQSGALNESLSDVLAALIEQDARPNGDWTVGEDLGVPLRDLAHPERAGNPSHMRDFVVLPTDPAHDMGGVHANSTIPSHAAYLVAEGGVHRVSGLRVEGVGRGALRAVWWRALSVYLGPRSGFRDFAEATRAAAEDLYGPRSVVTQAVRAAWRAVGVTP